MASRLALTAVFEPVEDGWVQGRVVEFPSVITAAPTIEEAKDLLVDAFREFLLTQGTMDPGVPGSDASIRESINVVIGVA